MLSVIILSVAIYYAECRYAECHNDECHYAKCRGPILSSFEDVGSLGEVSPTFNTHSISERTSFSSSFYILSTLWSQQAASCRLRRKRRHGGVDQLVDQVRSSPIDSSLWGLHLRGRVLHAHVPLPANPKWQGACKHLKFISHCDITYLDRIKLTS